MMAPLLSPTTSTRSPHPAEPLPEVRLDVRMGSGRTTGYDITRSEFLVGGGEGCDVRLPGAHFPAVICQVAHTDDGVLLRRLAPAFPMLLNGQALPGNSVLKLKSGDRIAVGSVDIVVNELTGGHLRPMFTEVKPTKAAAPVAAPQPNLDAFRRERAELDVYRSTISEQAKELEADRVAWYQRRQQIEAELQALQASTMAGGKLADREARLHHRETEVSSRERELTRVREELTEIRQTLFEQYRERRDQVEQMQQLVRGANSSLEARQSKTEAELLARAAELERERGQLQQYVDTEVNRRSELVEAEYRRRRMELDAQHDVRLRELDDQAHTRREQFATGLPMLGTQQVELVQQRDQLGSAFRELETQRLQLQAIRDDIQRERTALEAERRWQEEQRLEREQLHLSRERELDQQETHVQDERQALEEERRKHSDDILRLDRWQATVEERTLQMDRRAAEIDQRVQQLTRDAVELEESTALAEAERQQQTEEAARLTLWKSELEARTGQLSDRSAQLEAQQASLAVLRVRLDRQADDLHREAVALTNDRARLDASQRELDVRLQDAEHLRASLGSFHVTNSQAESTLAEQQKLLEATLNELRQQKERIREQEEQLQAKEAELDRRSADMAEQTAVLKAKTTLAMELHQRLQTDRDAMRHRELSLTDVDAARSTFQETLRKRADEIGQRDRDLNGSLASLADERLQLDRLRAEFTLERDRQENQLRDSLHHQAQRETELTGQLQLMAEREQALERQVDRLRESGRMIAAGRKELFEAKQQWQTEQATLVQQTVQTKDELSAFRSRALAEMDQLRAQAPGLENQAADALHKLASAREILRSQLSELHGYASQSRETLDRLRNDLRSESERLRGRETDVEKARDQHRIQVSEFRAQVVDWQSKIGDLRKAMVASETRIDHKKADIELASKKSDDAAVELARRLEQLRLEQDDLHSRRGQVEQHLSDMREWYRKKLRDLAGDKVELPPAPSTAVPTRIESHPVVVKLNAERNEAMADHDIEPVDRQLGELLASLDFVEPDTLNRLWHDAKRQGRTLRQMLLASGTITLYQLALIEAGQVEALVLGRFRVIDRVRTSPREASYRALDPHHPEQPCLVRVLGEIEMADATHPDEYRQRFATLMHQPHPNLPTVLDITDVNGRPAVVLELVNGLPGSEWPAVAALPGVWIQLMLEAARGLEAAHRLGLIHGRLTTDSFVLTTEGRVEVQGVADPHWLPHGASPANEPTQELDLRALGQVGYVWAMASGRKRGRTTKSFPDSLLQVVRRLDGEVDTPMGDTGSQTTPFESASVVVAVLEQLTLKYPCPVDKWADLMRTVNNVDDVPVKKAG